MVLVGGFKFNEDEDELLLLLLINQSRACGAKTCSIIGVLRSGVCSFVDVDWTFLFRSYLSLLFAI